MPKDLMDKTTNQIIHSFLGKGCWHQPGHYVGENTLTFFCPFCGLQKVPVIHRGPDYENDLNAVREAELKAIEEFGGGSYYSELAIVLHDAGWPGGYEPSALHYALAPASVRAKAIRKLVEENNGYWPSTEVDSQDTH